MSASTRNALNQKPSTLHCPTPDTEAIVESVFAVWVPVCRAGKAKGKGKGKGPRLSPECFLALRNRTQTLNPKPSTLNPNPQRFKNPRLRV